MSYTNDEKIKAIKNYFMQLFYIKEHIELLNDERKKLRILSVNIGSTTDAREVQSSCVSLDKIGDIVSDLVDLEIGYVNEINVFTDRKKKAIEKINTLTDERGKLILKLRYFEYLTWCEIAEKVDYSDRQVRRYHNNAIEMLIDAFSAEELGLGVEQIQ